MNKVVITGGTGAIGKALIALLIKNNIECLVLVRPDSKRNNFVQNPLVTVTVCQLSELKYFDAFLGNYDVFFHLGWDKTTLSGRDDVYAQLKNVEYTVDAVQLAKRMGVKSFVGAGSQAEYGTQTEPLTSDMPCFPQSGYGIAKLTANLMSKLSAQAVGIKHVWARILSVYGENDGSTSLISYLIDSFKSGTVPSLTKCGQIWDYIYADDCALALYLMAQYGKDGKSYPLGSGDKRSLKSYVEAVRNAIDKSLPINFGAKDYYPHQPMYLTADISDLTADTGFSPEYTFEQGIKRTIARKEELP